MATLRRLTGAFSMAPVRELVYVALLPLQDVMVASPDTCGVLV